LIETRCFHASRRSCSAALYKRHASPNCPSSSSLSRRVVNSRYLNVFLKTDVCLFYRIRRRILLSRLGPLIRYVSLDCRLGDRADASDVVRTAPQTGQIRLEPGKLFSKVVARKSLELCCQSCWRHRRVTLNEHVNVVGHDFQSVNLCLDFFRSLEQQLSQSLLKRVYKDALAILRTPHEVVLQRVHRTSVDPVAIINHALNSTPEFYSYQLSNQEAQEADRFPRQRKQAVPSI
jgi:hypothetical protein